MQKSEGHICTILETQICKFQKVIGNKSLRDISRKVTYVYIREKAFPCFFNKSSKRTDELTNEQTDGRNDQVTKPLKDAGTHFKIIKKHHH